jgi:hypothetical protein
LLKLVFSFDPMREVWVYADFALIGLFGENIIANNGGK